MESTHNAPAETTNAQDLSTAAITEDLLKRPDFDKRVIDAALEVAERLKTAQTDVSDIVTRFLFGG
jgi:hypothetical protein